MLSLLYLRALSTGDFRESLPALLGQDSTGLSPSASSRLTMVWQTDYAARRQRSFAGQDYVYVRVDGVHFNVRLEDDPFAKPVDTVAPRPVLAARRRLTALAPCPWQR